MDEINRLTKSNEERTAISRVLDARIRELEAIAIEQHKELKRLACAKERFVRKHKY